MNESSEKPETYSLPTALSIAMLPTPGMCLFALWACAASRWNPDMVDSVNPPWAVAEVLWGITVCGFLIYLAWTDYLKYQRLTLWMGFFVQIAITVAFRVFFWPAPH